MTPEQLAALKVDILAAQDLAPLAGTPDGRFEIARLYNLPHASTWIVWRGSVSREEILQNGFDWTRLDNLSVGKARVWSDIFVLGVINPSKPNVRAGIDSVWVGSAPDLAVRAAVYVHCKVQATRFIRLFSTGTGTDAVPATVDTPLTDTFRVSYNDVTAALALV